MNAWIAYTRPLMAAGWVAAALVSTNAVADTALVIDEDNSVVSFAVTKEQFVVEPAEFKRITGGVTHGGEVEFEIDITSLFSNNDTRDRRLLEMFFETDIFPEAIVSAEIDPALLTIDAPKRVSIDAVLEWYDGTVELPLDVLVVPSNDGTLVISSLSPTIIDARTFGVPADNVEALRDVCNRIAIADEAAVNFVLTLVEP
ncbi:MAG TPA: hypothetical protein DD979_07600 [Gammaproteobacteria bacterium]|jgi:polyisoprenoid-binding protein YceI|nr:hypothetical protein [Gammaproteobacteria bacterium]